MNYKIWVLADNRTGNVSQSIAIADELGINYEKKYIEYNFLSILPNCLLAIRPIHITKKSLDNLNAEILPDIVIASGRRLAPVALYLKKKAKNNLKVIQIMRPICNHNRFDLVILPQHDQFSGISPNIVRVIGALSNIKKRTDESSKDFQKNYPNIKNFIAVLVGGNNKSYKFSLESIHAFYNILLNISINNKLPLFISFSRRTPDLLKNILKKNFHSPNIIYDHEDNIPNPYVSLLKQADYIISTGDSISMCSEAASMGKPLYIFRPKDFNLKKHNFFIQQLIDLEVARNLDESTNSLQPYQVRALSEIERVAEIIRTELLEKPIT